MSSPHWEVVPEAARTAIEHLAQHEFLNRFYLGGGTGLALQIGHRISEDLDFFSEGDSLASSSREDIVGALAGELKEGTISVELEKDGTLILLLDGVSSSFFYYPYPPVAPVLNVKPGIRVAALADIGLMKLSAIIGRGTRRDFVDFYFLSQRFALDWLLGFADKKFPFVHDFALQALKALVYFEDAEADPAVRLIRPVEWEAVKEHFRREVGRLSGDMGVTA